MTKTVFVLSVSAYSFTDEATKRLNEGITVRYIITEDLSPIEDSEKRIKGYKPAKATMPISDYGKFTVVPAYYEATLDVSVDAAGAARVNPKEFTFKNSLTQNTNSKLKLSV